MTYEITIYTKFGFKCYDMEEESDEDLHDNVEFPIPNFLKVEPIRNWL